MRSFFVLDPKFGFGAQLKISLFLNAILGKIVNLYGYWPKLEKKWKDIAGTQLIGRD